MRCHLLRVMTTISLALVQTAHTPGLVAITSLADTEHTARRFNVHAKGVPNSTLNEVERKAITPLHILGLDVLYE